MLMKFFLILFITLIITAPISAKNIYCDADTDCYYIPEKVLNSDKPVPALLYLSCTGATKSQVDSIKFIGDSLNWIIFSCHATRNHRDVLANDRDIMKTYQKAIKNYNIDKTRVFIYGFSGQGVQALMEMFIHPDIFRGTVTQCAHAQALQLVQWSTLKKHLAYLVSREQDWNLDANYLIDKEFKKHEVRDTIVITPGEHNIGDAKELFRAVKWLKKNSQQK
jgi:predicted peptidase